MGRCKVLAALLAAGLAQRADACSTVAAGKKATVDGSVLLTQSDDGEARGDPRMCYIPAADHKSGDMRPIYWDTEEYPRFVGNHRGPCYTAKPGQTPSKAIGYIPEVEHTYGYYEGTYGNMNEHGLGIGETTCSGVFGASAVTYGGEALFSIDTLSRIALERTRTARDAVKLMGSLAEEKGFYGIGSFEGSAESLFVGDADEVYIFHILPDDTGKSAIWAAQRVPDDHVAVVANMFVIREINLSDEANFLFSKSVTSVAEAKGWWKPGTPLDFTQIYSNGEYSHKYYSGRRMWGAYHVMGVDGLPDEYSDLRYNPVYPVTAKPATGSVSVDTFFKVHRYYYEGTKYDMTKGMAAGPFSDPDRFVVDPSKKGNWERSIGLYRTTSTHVVQLKNSSPGVLWFGPHNAPSTVFVPLLSTGSSVPEALQIGDPTELSRESAYWAYRFSYNVAKIMFSYAYKEITSLQQKFESEGQQLVTKLSGAPTAQVDAAVGQHVANVVSAFWKVTDVIMQDYSNGWLKDGTSVGYPDDWLKAVDYQNGPPPVPSGPGSCTDNQVRSCVQNCKTDGYAACAASCTSACSAEAHKAALKLEPETFI